MPPYNLFSKHYDVVMGTRAKSTALLQQLIKTYHPGAQTVLELACGTGTVLKQLAKKYEVYGLDISSGMLKRAKAKVPKGKFSLQDMRTFAFERTFDIIYCVFDSINHVVHFSDWKKVFSRACKHLAPGGVFIFDMNTAVKLNRLAADPPYVYWFGQNIMIMDIVADGKDKVDWRITVFEHEHGKQYTKYDDDIQEAAFTPTRVRAALARFGSVKMIDPERKRTSSKSERLFFVCQK
jgi:SAM-dependent methyltransferase